MPAGARAWLARHRAAGLLLGGPICSMRTTALRRRLVDNQIAVVVDREPGLARFRHHRGMPVDLAGVGTADDRHQQRLGAAGEIAEAAIDADRHVAHVALVEINGLLGVSVQPKYLPAAFD